MKSEHVCGRTSVSFLFYVPIFNSVSITVSISRAYPTMLISMEYITMSKVKIYLKIK